MIVVFTVVGCVMAAKKQLSRGHIKWTRKAKSWQGDVNDADQELNKQQPNDDVEGSGASFDLTAQADRSAHYYFRSDVDDGIKDGRMQREESRNGLVVNGSYSFSDGFFQRTIEYRADEHGYRVTK